MGWIILVKKRRHVPKYYHAFVTFVSPKAEREQDYRYNKAHTEACVDCYMYRSASQLCYNSDNV